MAQRYEYNALGRMTKMMLAGDKDDAPTHEYSYEYGGTTIRILDRAGLLVRAGASYGIPEAEYLRLIGSPT